MLLAVMNNCRHGGYSRMQTMSIQSSNVPSQALLAVAASLFKVAQEEKKRDEASR